MTKRQMRRRRDVGDPLALEDVAQKKREGKPSADASLDCAS